MGIKDKIMRRVKAHGRGGRVFTPPDFVDLASRGGVDQALSRLVRDGELRRVARGMYDWPRHSKLLGRTAPVAADDVAAVVGKRAGAVTAPDNLAAANALGLTTAVLSRPSYASSKRVTSRDAAGVHLQFRPVGAKLAPLLNTDAAIIVQALAWARAGGFDLDDVAQKIALRASPKAKAALRANLKLLPVWALAPAQQILGIVR